MKEEMVKIGKCRFCGQMMTLDKEMTEHEAEEIATLQCGCQESVIYERDIKRRQKAIMNITELFGHGAQNGKVAEEIVKILKEAVEIIQNGSITKIALEIRGGTKATISMNGKGEISVERTETKKQKLTE